MPVRIPWYRTMFKNVAPWRIAVVVVAGFVTLSVVLWMLGFAVRAGLGIVGYDMDSVSLSGPVHMQGGGTKEMMNYGRDDGAVSDAAYPEMMVRGSGTPGMSLPAPTPNYVPGTDAEEYETTDYYATVRALNSDAVCDEIEWLKDSTEVIFEYADRSEYRCSYQFKVTVAQAPAVVTMIERFNPEELTAHTRTIKQELEVYTDELTILEEKLAAIDETLIAAEAAYEELTSLAGSADSPESLARVISSRIEIIERLTRERLMVAQEITRYQKARADALERLSYSQFSISVYEYRIFDWQMVKDQWADAAQQLVREANAVLQGVTIGLLAFLLRLVQFALYLAIIVVVIRFGWHFVRRLWEW